MLDTVAGVLGIALAITFYAVTVYHLCLVLIGLRISPKGLPPFDKGSLRNPVDLPKVSLIIPAKDEEAVIEGAIRCADALTYPRDYLEIIVVEDGSTDGTPGIAREMQNGIPNLVVLSGGETKGKPAALNRALRSSSGEVVAIFDSDTRYDPDILLRTAKYFHDHPDVAIVQAFPEVRPSDKSLLTKLNAIEMHAWFRGMQAAKSHMGLFVHLGGTGIFIRRQVFDTLGAWDENALTEDLEFSWRVSRAGFKAAMLPASIRVQPTYTARAFLQQRRRWWGGALQVARKATGARSIGNPKLRARLDAATYLAAPLVFLVGSVFLGVSLAYLILRADISATVLAWVIGALGSNILFVPLVLVDTVRSRKPGRLLLLPGLYVYWALQLVSLVWAFLALVGRSRIRWVRTPKRPSAGRA